jgi:glycosyltransferase involved in cell wall biosynthesis
MNGVPKIGILVVAYNAEKTLEAVLARIPSDFIPEISAILIADDASNDFTANIAQQIKKSRIDLPITVIEHQSNLGYGGNQKAGYSWMIDNDLDIVVLLHGDGQYAPEYLPKMIEPITNKQADVVFGSRMLSKGLALKGGMPKYKFIGNKILTFWQNLMSGAKLSEWHSGYRAYSTTSLKKTRYLDNSDYFDFDTEIILQMLDAQQRICEIPIPTFYGDELSRVNGIKYGWRVAKHTTKWRINRRRKNWKI